MTYPTTTIVTTTTTTTTPTTNASTLPFRGQQSVTLLRWVVVIVVVVDGDNAANVDCDEQHINATDWPLAELRLLLLLYSFAYVFVCKVVASTTALVLLSTRLQFSTLIFAAFHILHR